MSGRITGSKAGITASAMCGALMAVLDISIVNVATADIRASFGAALDEIAWVSTSYMMANVVVIPMTGWAQRRFGARAYFAASLLLFALASALCGAAWSLPSLMAFRVLQGIGGGAIIPTAQSILLARYPPEEHGLAGALFGLGAITGPLLGPSLGGYLIDVLDWHWIFLVNVPLGVMASALAWRHIGEPDWVRAREPIDARGIALIVVAMASLQYVLEEGNRHDWWEDTGICVASAAAFVALVTFVAHEFETDAPVVDLRIFAERRYACATAINFLVGVAAFSAAWTYAVYCGTVMRYSAAETGRVFLAAGAIQVVLMPIAASLMKRVDGRALVAVGVVATATSLYLHGQVNHLAGFWQLVRPRFVLAIGLAFLYVPLSVVALSALPDARRGGAAGLFNLTRELGGSIGTAWMATSLTRGVVTHGAHLRERVDLWRPEAVIELAGMRAFLGGRVADPVLGAYALMAKRVAQQALVKSFGEAFVAVAAVFALSLPLVLLLRDDAKAAPRT